MQKEIEKDTYYYFQTFFDSQREPDNFQHSLEPTQYPSCLRILVNTEYPQIVSAETILFLILRKLFKGRNYSRVETVCGNTVSFSVSFCMFPSGQILPRYHLNDLKYNMFIASNIFCVYIFQKFFVKCTIYNIGGN